MTMNLVFCWTDITGYMAACWRELARIPGLSVSVLAPETATKQNAAFRAEVMSGLDHHSLPAEKYANASAVAEIVHSLKPDVLALCGWYHQPFRALAGDPGFRQARFLLFLDNPYRGDLRQCLGRVALRSFLRRMDAVFVPGERAWQFAKFLRIPEERIWRGSYGFDHSGFSAALERRRQLGDWPKRFCFTGQYIERKGIPQLLRAYEAYRQEVEEPWPLTCIGMGPLAGLLRVVVGVADEGFVQPQELPGKLAQAGAFVLPSLEDHWGVALAEACAAGLPVIATEACGASVELVRLYYNGLTVATGNVAELVRALRYMHENHEALPEMGARSAELARPFGAPFWARRVHAAIGRPDPGRAPGGPGP